MIHDRKIYKYFNYNVYAKETIVVHCAICMGTHQRMLSCTEHLSYAHMHMHSLVGA